MDDDTILGHHDGNDEDGATDSDWDEHATLIALLDDEYVTYPLTVQLCHFTLTQGWWTRFKRWGSYC
jgi:hypothetical protein